MIVNVTAIMTEQQVERVAECLAPNVPAIVSVFAGRIADTGRDPVPLMRACAARARQSPEGRTSLGEPARAAQHLPGRRDRLPHHHRQPRRLAKLSLVGKDLDEYSLETVKMFHRDAHGGRFHHCNAGAPGGVLSLGNLRDRIPDRRRRGNAKQVFARIRDRRRRLCRLRADAAAARPRLQGHGLRYFLFGDNFLPKSNPNLHVIQGDIRDTAKLAKALAGHDAFVSLACISNDASFELDEKLSTSVNLDSFEPMVVAAKKAGVKRFVFARRARSTASPTSRT